MQPRTQTSHVYHVSISLPQLQIFSKLPDGNNLQDYLKVLSQFSIMMQEIELIPFEIMSLSNSALLVQCKFDLERINNPEEMHERFVNTRFIVKVNEIYQVRQCGTFHKANLLKLYSTPEKIKTLRKSMLLTELNALSNAIEKLPDNTKWKYAPSDSTIWLSLTSQELLTKIKSKMVSMGINENNLAINSHNDRYILTYRNVDFETMKDFVARSETDRMLSQEHKATHAHSR